MGREKSTRRARWANVFGGGVTSPFSYRRRVRVERPDSSAVRFQLPSAERRRRIVTNSAPNRLAIGSSRSSRLLVSSLTA